MNRTLILGLGAGQCGLSLLPQILNSQPGTRVTHEEVPWLPWEKRKDGPGIRERLRRIVATTTERYVGDVASFYLPYAEEAIDAVPDIRIVCLARPRDDVVAGFRQSLELASGGVLNEDGRRAAARSSEFSRNEPEPVPNSLRPAGMRINHWAKVPALGWSHDLFRTSTYPQYDTSDLVEGIRRYWEEYYSAANELQKRYPGQFRIWDTEALTVEAGVREVLTFVGIPPAEHVLVTGLRVPSPPSRAATALVESGGPTADESGQSGRRVEGVEKLRAGGPERDGRKGCVVLVPFTGFIHQDCDNALKELERRGYPVRRVGGYAAIDQARNQMASDALRDGFDETLWIDSDIGFDPDSVERLRSHGLPLVCGVYPKKGQRAIACNVLPGTPRMLFGDQGGLAELLYAGAGFLLVRREVYLKVQRHWQLPTCNERYGEPLVPFFYPLLHPVDDGHWYLAEDYAFCERARACGYRIFADTTIRLWHIGTYRYGWEDAGIEPARYRTFTLNFGDQPAAARNDGAENGGTDDDARVKEFAACFPWPAERPVVPAAPDRNWLFPAAREILAQSLSAETRLVVELGSWTGRSTRYIADLAPRARVVAVDHWKGSAEHAEDPELAAFLPRLYETFISECWEYRARLIPVRARSIEGLRRICDAGLHPDLVYIDADHRYESVVADLTATLDLFPHAAIAGDDWDWESVRSAVEQVARERGLDVQPRGSAWRIVQRGLP